jgi:hypothetical protein
VTPDSDEPKEQPSVAEPPVPKPLADAATAGQPQSLTRAAAPKERKPGPTPPTPWSKPACYFSPAPPSSSFRRSLSGVTCVIGALPSRSIRKPEKLVLDHGIEFDLPSALIDDLDAKITGVNEIVKAQAFEKYSAPIRPMRFRSSPSVRISPPATLPGWYETSWAFRPNSSCKLV